MVEFIKASLLMQLYFQDKKWYESKDFSELCTNVKHRSIQ